MTADNYNYKQENQDLKRKTVNLSNQLESINQELSLLRIEKQQNLKKRVQINHPSGTNIEEIKELSLT